jgi:GDP-L-fucose synthase
VAWLAKDTTLENRTVLVTGGHGFIGRHVVAALAQAGANPISTIHPQGVALPELPGATLTVELEDPNQVVEVVDGADMVVHLAARAGGIQFQRQGDSEVFAANRRITDNLLAAAADSQVQRFFLASSLVTYRPIDDLLTEAHRQLGPADDPEAYALSKIHDEAAASRQLGLETVVGRLGNVYGPGASFEPDRSTVIHALIDRAARLPDGDDLVVWGDGDAIRSFVFVTDAAQGVVSCLARGESGEAYNIDSGEETTIARLAAAVRDEVNPSLALVFDPSKPSGPQHRVGSISKLTGLGYVPSVTLEEGVGRTVEWYRKHLSFGR